MMSALKMKNLKSLVVDTNAIIKGVRVDIMAEELWTVEEVLAEVRDKGARQFLSTLPAEIKTREPDEECLKKVIAFARATGDIHTLSAPDLKLLALTLTLESLAHGIAHLRSEPSVPLLTTTPRQQLPEAALPGWGQVNNPEDWAELDQEEEDQGGGHAGQAARGASAAQSRIIQGVDVEVGELAGDMEEDEDEEGDAGLRGGAGEGNADDGRGRHAGPAQVTGDVDHDGHHLQDGHDGMAGDAHEGMHGDDEGDGGGGEEGEWEVARSRSSRVRQQKRRQRTEERERMSAVAGHGSALVGAGASGPRADSVGDVGNEGKEEEEDEEEEEEEKEEVSCDWHDVPTAAARLAGAAGQATGGTGGGPPLQPYEMVESSVGCLTSDFAMQNVLLQMGLRLVSVDGLRVRRVQRWALKCDACFTITRDMSRIFCPKCGNGATLNKVSVSVDANGAWCASAKKRPNLRGTRVCWHTHIFAGVARTVAAASSLCFFFHTLPSSVVVDILSIHFLARHSLHDFGLHVLAA
eukprot:jgi/Mesvir1/28975/Mv17749-RA.1